MTGMRYTDRVQDDENFDSSKTGKNNDERLGGRDRQSDSVEEEGEVKERGGKNGREQKKDGKSLNGRQFVGEETKRQYEDNMKERIY